MWLDLNCDLKSKEIETIVTELYGAKMDKGCDTIKNKGC